MGTQTHRYAVLLAALLVAGPATAGCFDQFMPGRAAAYDFLRADVFTSLVIEVDYVDGAAPHADATSLLKQRAEERLRKPDGITVEATRIPGGDSQWSVSDLRAAEDRNRDTRPAGGRMSLYVLYVDGDFADDSRVLGVHYGPTSVAMFKDRIKAGSLAGLSVADAERAVLIHEFGHVIGLVDNGIPMVTDHEDDAHSKHSQNPNSVMYYQVETSEISLLTGTPPTNFDSDDIADIRAAGGK
jgi:hypothetical protein